MVNQGHARQPRGDLTPAERFDRAACANCQAKAFYKNELWFDRAACAPAFAHAR